MSEYSTINLPSKPEEKKIYELVNIISALQEKIESIKQQTEPTKYNPIYRKILETNSEIKSIKNKINQLQNEKRQKEINFNKEKMDLELNIKKIDDELTSINSQLNDMMLGGEKGDKEIYRVSNDKIEEILLNKKNEDNFQGLTIDYNSMMLGYQKLLNDLNTNLDKKRQLDEQVKMLKEEKNTINEKLIEYISQKESYEEMAKIILLRYFNKILNYNMDSNNNKLSEKQIKDFELSNGATTSLLLKSKNFSLNNNYNFNISKDNLVIYSYELNNIDIKKLSNEISSQLISYISNCMKSLNDNNTSMNLLVSNNNSILNKSNNNNSLNNSKIYYKETNSLTKSLSSKICKNILKFISESNGKNDNINIFFSNLSKEITNLLNYYFMTQLKIKINEVDNNITDDLFVAYIKLMFKTFYLDNIIIRESNFLNNEYKNIKNNIKSIYSLTMANITKLNIKKNEYDSQLNHINKEKQLLSNDILLQSSNLSLRERAYLHLTIKSNQLIELKKGIQKDFLNKKNNINIVLNKISEKIEQYTKNIENLYNKLDNLQNQMKKRMEIGKLEISKIQKMISDNFGKIKNEMSIYKKKYGNNLELYDKFVDNINNYLRATSKSKLRKKASTSNSFYAGDNSYIISPKNLNPNSFISSVYNFLNGTLNKEYNNKSFSCKKNNNAYNLSESMLLNENDFIPHNKTRNYDDNNKNFIFNSYTIDNRSKQIFNKGGKNNNLMNEKNKLMNAIDILKEKITEKNLETQEILNTINNSKSISNNDLQEKFKNLTKLYQCYFRQFNATQKIFDPLYHSTSIENHSMFNFEICYIKLFFEMDNIYLLIFKGKKLLLKINVINLEMTIINKNIKYITKIYQKFKKYLEICGNDFDLDEFVESKELENIPMDVNKKKLAVNNIYYNFSIVILDNKIRKKDRYEFVVEGYDNFKTWVNSLNYLINYKNVISDE